MNTFNIQKAYKRARDMKWDKVYWAIDIHDTVLKCDYEPGSVGGDFFSGAKEVLQKLSRRPEVVLIAYTSSYNHANILEFFHDYDILFKYVNENPECKSTDLGDFSSKFYFNILLDNKAGFDGDLDWSLVDMEMRTLDINNKLLNLHF